MRCRSPSSGSFIAGSSCVKAPMGLPVLTASEIRATDDARPAAMGTIAYGKTRVSRSGSTEMTSGTPMFALSLAPSTLSSSAMSIRPFRARSEEVHGLQVTRGRSHQRLAAAPARGIRRPAHLGPHMVREILDLALHVQHTSPHL